MNSNDKRFNKIGADPKFKRLPKTERKVKIDKRFQSIFNDKRFKVKYTIDKRGRPIHGSTTDDFKKFYHISDDEKDDTNSEQGSGEDITQELKDESLIEDDNNIKRSEIDKKITNRLKDTTLDYARGDGVLMSDSSSDDDTSSDEENEGDYNKYILCQFILLILYVFYSYVYRKCRT